MEEESFTGLSTRDVHQPKVWHNFGHCFLYNGFVSFITNFYRLFLTWQTEKEVNLPYLYLFIEQSLFLSIFIIASYRFQTYVIFFFIHWYSEALEEEDDGREEVDMDGKDGEEGASSSDRHEKMLIVPV